MTSFVEYLTAIKKKLALGDATEETHRGALERLLEAADPGIVATNEPKRIACGAPDFNVTRNKVPLGHIETKDIGVSLDEVERGKGPNGDQFKRYRDALPNWILTDYLEFRWFVAGEKRLTVRLAEIDGQGKLRAFPEGERKLGDLLKLFFAQTVPTVGTAKELAARMAGMTRNIRDLIIATFSHGAAPDKGWLGNWLASFREVLIPDLDEAQFADMFAQTLAYGLFAARVNKPQEKTFSRELAAFSLPRTNPFLRKLFAEFAGVDMPETFGWAVDDIVELLKHVAMDEVLKDFGKGKGKEDPVVHFYETFLTAYDPKTRELRGVYYTPEPVVSYIVRSVDYLLKSRFNRPKGLADENTLILDPATGTATFLYFVVRQIYEQFGGQKGAWDSYVSQRLLNRIFGFELLVAPYAVAHLKLGMELQETGYKFGSDQRLGVYLTNTLEEAAKRSEKLFAQWISDEANAAAEIKRDKPILVVLGNPPYSGHSANRSRDDNGRLTFIGKLIEDYKKVDGQPLAEKNPKWLQDDYVKFIRFAQWRIDRTGYGILGFITNHGYLDNPTFRGMRQSLMESFSDIYVFNLHGNSKKRERAPDGGEDVNVFDIQQGVAITLAAKQPRKRGLCRVWQCDLWGSRDHKYSALSSTGIRETKWRSLQPASPDYSFVPISTQARDEYLTGWPISTAMPESNVGIVTARDSLSIHFTAEEAWKTVRNFVQLSVEEARAKYQLGTDVRDWRVAWAQEDLRQAGPSRRHIAPIMYRPFDIRYTYYTGRSRGFHCYPRQETMRHILAGSNLALITTRLTKDGWDALVSRSIVGHKSLAAYDINYLFPLYLYDGSREAENGQGELGVHSAQGPGHRRPNLGSAFVTEVSSRLGLTFVPDGKGDLRSTFGPEDALDYTYAVFHSPQYRTRYAEFLRTDFPRLPLTGKLPLFRRLAEMGSQLVALHLMESPRLNHLITTFPEKGTGEVERVTYVDGTRRVCVNSLQYFQGIPREVWEFHIGGYQVLEKWLKDRKGRVLTWDDIQHYQRVVVALKETIGLMNEIDAAIDANGGWPLQ